MGDSQAQSSADEPIFEWRPGRRTLVAWNVLAAPLFAAGLTVYGLIALHGEIPKSYRIDSAEMLIVAALILGLGVVHEAIHGLAMLAFGGSPKFGVLKIGGILAGLYATDPGRRFGRTQYLIICLAPLVVITPIGLLACMLPFGAWLMVPFAGVFAGCIGDLNITWHVLRGPRDALCEDLRDGLRLWAREA
jgi:hypothetical protein